MYFLCIVGICKLEAYPLRWIMFVLFYFMHLAFFLRTALILCFIMVNAKKVSLPLLLVKKLYILFWLLTYLLLLFIPYLDIFISIIVFGSINQKLNLRRPNFYGADLWSNMKNSYTLKCSPQSQKGFDVRMFLNHFLEEI